MKELEAHKTESKSTEKTLAPVLIGWREWISLPELGVSGIRAKVDTGARTSALHAFRIREFQRDKIAWVSFVLHPVQRLRNPQLDCEAPIHDFRQVTSSNGARESRYVICTSARVGPVNEKILITLTNRDAMGFRMLLGREALNGRFLVDPNRSFSLGKFRASHFYPPTKPTSASS